MPEERPPLLASTKAGAEAKSWHEYQRQAQQETPKRLEDAAKFLAGMISISFSIFLTINEAGFKGKETSIAVTVALFTWLLSLLFAFRVIFPSRYRYAATSAEDIRAMHRRVVRQKYLLLVISAGLFVAALGILGTVYLINLSPS